jgi:hypothetical protein
MSASANFSTFGGTNKAVRASISWPILSEGVFKMRKTLLAVALMATGFTAHADYQCSVTPRDDVVLSPQTVQVKGENGNLVITPEGNVTFNGKQYNLTAAQREQAKDYQADLRTALPWINEGALTRVEKAAWRWIRSSPKRWVRAAICAPA